MRIAADVMGDDSPVLIPATATPEPIPTAVPATATPRRSGGTAATAPAVVVKRGEGARLSHDVTTAAIIINNEANLENMTRCLTS